MAGNSFTFHDQIPMRNAVESQNPKFELDLSSCYESISAKVVWYFLFKFASLIYNLKIFRHMVSGTLLVSYVSSSLAKVRRVWAGIP